MSDSKKSASFVGKAGLFHYQPDNPAFDVEINCTLHPKEWRKGYATELSLGMLAWGFDQLKINRLTALTLPDNAPSIGVLVKIGMHFVKKIILEDGEYLVYEKRASVIPCSRE